MKDQITLNNLLPMEHLVELGRGGNVSYYRMDENNPKDRSFFDHLQETGIEQGAEMSFQRGELTIRVRCIEIREQECRWRKIR